MGLFLFCCMFCIWGMLLFEVRLLMGEERLREAGGGFR